MPREFPRTRRVAEQVQRELAGLIRDEVRDPRVGPVTVSEVRVSRDLGYADVHVTGLGMEAEASREMVAALNHAAGFLRTQLGRRLRLRTVPALRFRHDDAFDRGARVSRLIDEALADDASRRDD